MKDATPADKEESTEAFSAVQEEPIQSTAVEEEHTQSNQVSPAIQEEHSQYSAVQEEPIQSTAVEEEYTQTTRVSPAIQEEHIQARAVHVEVMSTPGRGKVKVSHYCGITIRMSPRLREKACKKEVEMSLKDAELNYVNINAYEEYGEHVKSWENVVDGVEIEVEKEDELDEDIVEDELDDCCSKDSYNSFSSVDDEFSEEDEECSSDDELGPTCLDVGQTFEDMDNFRMALREHAILKNFEIKFVKNQGQATM